MQLLNDAPVSFCFEIGRRLWQIEATVRLRDDPALDWTRDDHTLGMVAHATGQLQDRLAPYLLSEPAHQRLEELRATPFSTLMLLQELMTQMLDLDLARSQDRARWLLAAQNLSRLETLESSSDGATRAREQIENFDTWSAEALRAAAAQLTPDRVDETVARLERLRQTHGREWIPALAQRVGDDEWKASTEPLGAPDRPTARCAWSPVRLFMSHSSRDKAVVRRIDSQLRKHATVDVYLDERELAIGDALGETLRAAIARVDFVLAVISENSVRSDWMRLELEFARELGIPVLPLRIDDSPVPAALENFVHDDASTGIENAIERVICAVTDNPSLRFLGKAPDADVQTELEITQVGLASEVWVRVRTRRPRHVEGLRFTTVAHWDIEQPGAMTNKRRGPRPQATAAEIRAAPGSRVEVERDASADADRPASVPCLLYTTNEKGNGLGLYPYLLGVEVLLDGFETAIAGLVLANLHGSEVQSYTRTAGFRDEHLRARELGREVLRVVPQSCAIDDAIRANLRELANVSL